MSTKNYWLAHHGIKGQQWGVRRGPPYPIEDKVLKKGTRLNSVSNAPNADKYRKSGRWLYTYNPGDKWDETVYKGPFSVYRSNYLRKTVYEHRFETVKDLKMPTSTERMDAFKDLYSRAKDMVAKDLTDHWELRNRYGAANTDKIDFSNLSSKSDYANAYVTFNRAMENFRQYKSTTAYAKLMSKKYDAMVDDNNQGVYNKAHDPVIIFDAKSALKKIGPTSVVEMNTIIDNYKKVAKELGKPPLL